MARESILASKPNKPFVLQTEASMTQLQQAASHRKTADARKVNPAQESQHTTAEGEFLYKMDTLMEFRNWENN